MGFRTKFDAAEAAAIRKGIENLAGIPSRVAGPVAKSIRRLITKQFNRGRDPFGRPWAALAAATIRKGRRPPPLTDTRKMRRGIRVLPARPAGITIEVPNPGGFHQFGTRHMPKRQILPLQPPVLPKAWTRAITKHTDDEFDRSTG
jgi:hypothetical protein